VAAVAAAAAGALGACGRSHLSLYVLALHEFTSGLRLEGRGVGRH
jgi:hypothetical protein